MSFSRGKSERGYDRFFARALAGIGGAENSLTLSNLNAPSEAKSEIQSEHLPLRLGLEAGYQVLDYHLALHGGFEYTHSDLPLLKNEDASYNYLTLNLGASYYLPIPSKWPRLLHNTHFGVQLRLPLDASVSFTSSHIDGEVKTPLEADGLGLGLSLGKEWYTSDWKIWGVSLSYSIDRFQIPEQKVNAPAVGPVGIPGTPAQPQFKISGVSEMRTIGLNFSLAYD